MLRSQGPLLSTGRREGVCVAGKNSSGSGSVLRALNTTPRPGRTFTTGTSFTAYPSSRIIPIRNYRGKTFQPFPREPGGLFPGALVKSFFNPFLPLGILSLFFSCLSHFHPYETKNHAKGQPNRYCFFGQEFRRGEINSLPRPREFSSLTGLMIMK